MRINTAQSFDAAISQLQKRQIAMSESQLQLTSGKRVMRASDDPASAARAERAMAAMARSEASMRSLDTSRSATMFTEAALGDAGELLQQAREVMVGAGNGSYSDNDRKSLAAKLSGLRNDLFSVGNRSDGNGRYLFSGQGSNVPPFVDGPGGVSYAGTIGQLQAAAGEAATLTFDGDQTWLRAPDPANPGGTLSVFDVMDRLITELNTPGRTGAVISQSVTTGLRDLDTVMTNLSSWRARAGEGLVRADGIEERLSQSKLDAQTERSKAEDLDMVAAISDFQSKQTGYDAALKTYSIVQRMSLVDYLK